MGKKRSRRYSRAFRPGKRYRRVQSDTLDRREDGGEVVLKGERGMRRSGGGKEVFRADGGASLR
jgi:hypothetical protein